MEDKSIFVITISNQPKPREAGIVSY